MKKLVALCIVVVALSVLTISAFADGNDMSSQTQQSGTSSSQQSGTPSTQSNTSSSRQSDTPSTKSNASPVGCY